MVAPPRWAPGTDSLPRPSKSEAHAYHDAHGIRSRRPCSPIRVSGRGRRRSPRDCDWIRRGDVGPGDVLVAVLPKRAHRLAGRPGSFDPVCSRPARFCSLFASHLRVMLVAMPLDCSPLRLTDDRGSLAQRQIKAPLPELRHGQEVIRGRDGETRASTLPLAFGRPSARQLRAASAPPPHDARTSPLDHGQIPG